MYRYCRSLFFVAGSQIHQQKIQTLLIRMKCWTSLRAYYCWKFTPNKWLVLSLLLSKRREVSALDKPSALHFKTIRSQFYGNNPTSLLHRILKDPMQIPLKCRNATANAVWAFSLLSRVINSGLRGKTNNMPQEAWVIRIRSVAQNSRKWSAWIRESFLQTECAE